MQDQQAKFQVQKKVYIACLSIKSNRIQYKYMTLVWDFWINISYTELQFHKILKHEYMTPQQANPRSEFYIEYLDAETFK